MKCYYCRKDCETQKIEVYSKHCDPPDERDVCEDCECDKLENCVNCGSAHDNDGVVRTDWYQIIPYEKEEFELDYVWSGYTEFDVISFFETHYHCDSCMKVLFEGMSWLEIYEKCNKDEKNGMLLLSASAD